MDKDDIKRQVSMEQLLGHYGRRAVAGKKVLSQKMFLKEKRENISVLPRQEWSILLGFSNLGRIEKSYGFSQFRYLRQNQIVEAMTERLRR